MNLKIAAILILALGAMSLFTGCVSTDDSRCRNCVSNITITSKDARESFFLGGADYFIRDQCGREYKLNLGSKTKNWCAFHNLNVGDERIVRASSVEITVIEGFQYDPCLTGITILIMDNREDFHWATDGVLYYYPGGLSPGEYRVNVDPEGLWGGNRWPEITINSPQVCQPCCVERCCPCP